MFENVDTYTIRARLAPAFIVLLPIGMAIGSWLPTDQEYLGLLSTAVGTLALTALLSQLARHPGKRLQERLFKEWGGMPSVLMLSFERSQLPHGTLRLCHEKLNTLVTGLKLPLSLEEEQQDSLRAYSDYQVASDWLVAATRDREAFRLVYSENVNYGYCRNLLGLKPHCLITWTVGLVTCGLRAISHLLGPPFPAGWNWLSIVYTLACLVVILVLLGVVNSKWVRVVAEEYAKQLVATSLRL